METLEQLQQLVYAYDLSTLGIECIVPNAIKDLDLSEDAINAHMSTDITLESRAELVAYSACFFKYLAENPGGTEDDFTKRADPVVFDKVCKDIETKLTPQVDREKLREFHRINFAATTRLDRGRQVK